MQVMMARSVTARRANQVAKKTAVPKQKDRLHLTAKGLVTVGDQFFRLYEQARP